MTKEQAELLDQMLNVINQRGYTNPNYRIFADEMSTLLHLNRKQIETYWKTFFGKVRYNDLPVADYIENSGSPSLRVNSNTYEFVVYGGFTKLFENEKQNEAEEQRLKQLQEQKLLNDIASFKITKKQYVVTTFFAIAGFVIAIVTLVWQILK